MAKRGRKKINPKSTRKQPRENDLTGLYVLQNDGRIKRAPYVGPPTEQERRIIYSYACYGATDQDIRTIMGMSNETLYKYFYDELKEGRAQANSKIAQRLYQIAVGRDEMKNDNGQIVQEPKTPNLSALIFLAKVRLGWNEVQVIESKEIKTSVQIYIPDNGMKADVIEIEDESENNGN